MKKICHITSAHQAEDDRIFYKECVTLARAGYDVFLVQQGESYEKNSVHIKGFGSAASSRLRRIFETSKQAYEKALEVNADVYHLHDPELLLFAVKLKRQKKKVIFDSHERYTRQLRGKTYLPRWCSSMVAWLYGKYENYVLKKIDAVIFPCTMGGENPFSGLCRRSAIISNAAMLDEFYEKYNPNIEKTDNQICYVGGLTEARGITYLVKAASRSEACLALAGGFSPEGYEHELRSLDEFSSVQYHGILNREDVVELIAKSHIGICTLLNNGQYYEIDTFGIKVFEYLSMGLPVILSDSPYNLKMIEQYRFGICVDPSNIDQIANAIRYLLNHPDQAKIMGENGRRAIKDVFNWDVEGKKLIDLYEDILKETGD